ncbi:hypothetical protein EJ08DRAFT_678404 [Tothia fuscella]|uniref:Uncharacterized protein n=1 Tax=Tothia fuscella TaxID=1048955 RepID=A0A9P4TZY2_9PEZI|nr:hypothetical protein EJ08DRAFT_678404 [Tothia fuscella]
MADLHDYTDQRVDLSLNHESNPQKFGDNHSILRLLFTCRTTYTELCPILYSTNHFIIDYQGKGSLHALFRLSNTALIAMRSLTVQLNMTAIGANTLPRFFFRNGPTQPFRATCREHLDALTEWEEVASRLFTHCSLPNLHFRFVCDVADIECATKAVKPFSSIAFPLAQCDIRLGRDPNPVLEDIAQNVAKRAMGIHFNPPLSAFRFLDLPVEIKLHLLKYTDLITPNLEIEWCPEKGFAVEYAMAPCHFSEEWIVCTPHSHYTSNSDAAKPTPALIMRPPSVVADTPLTPPPVIVIPRSVIHFLRFIEIVFPPFEKDYLLTLEPAYQQWLQTVASMENELHLAKVTLRVYMADLNICAQDQRLPDYYHRIAEERGIILERMHERVIQPLTELKGLSKFFVHSVWPFARVEALTRWHQADPKFVAVNKNMGDKYEKLVMGASYNSVLMNEPPISQWLTLTP